MVSNAKYYNEKGSTLFSNAERIRKIVAASMPKLNPAYKDPNYVPFSTPVPEDIEETLKSISDRPSVQPDNDEHKQPEEISVRRTPKSIPTPGTNNIAVSEPDIDSVENANGSFEGDSFESAQERIISEMIRLKDEEWGFSCTLLMLFLYWAAYWSPYSGREVFYPFLSKPDRNLYKEYYEIIKHPISLRAILKLVRGTDGRKNSTKKTPFRSWQSFEEEVSYIWQNAREFNEDGSEIFVLAGTLKVKEID